MWGTQPSRLLRVSLNPLVLLPPSALLCCVMWTHSYLAWQVDPALLRPGRLDRSVECGVPSSDDRVAILHCLTRTGINLAADVDLHVVARACADMTGADLKAVLGTAQLGAAHQVLAETMTSSGPVGSSPCSNPTGLQTIRVHCAHGERGTACPCRESAQAAATAMSVHDPVSSEGGLPATVAGRRRVVVTMRQLMDALRETRPSLSGPERARYSRIYRDFARGQGLDSTEVAGHATHA